MITFVIATQGLRYMISVMGTRSRRDSDYWCNDIYPSSCIPPDPSLSGSRKHIPLHLEAMGGGGGRRAVTSFRQAIERGTSGPLSPADPSLLSEVCTVLCLRGPGRMQLSPLSRDASPCIRNTILVPGTRSRNTSRRNTSRRLASTIRDIVRSRVPGTPVCELPFALSRTFLHDHG